MLLPQLTLKAQGFCGGETVSYLYIPASIPEAWNALSVLNQDDAGHRNQDLGRFF